MEYQLNRKYLQGDLPMNLARNLELSAQFFPNKPAIREGALELTYAQLNEQVNRVATGLIKLGVKPGELVGMCAPNSADWIAFSTLALLRQGLLR